MHDQGDQPTDFPPTEESIIRLRRSGWSTGEAAFTGSSGRTVYQVDGRNGENSLLVRASTQRDPGPCVHPARGEVVSGRGSRGVRDAGGLAEAIDGVGGSSGGLPVE